MIGVVIVAALLALVGALSVRLVQQYQRGVVFRFGRVLTPVREPGLRLIVPVADRMVRVSMQTTVIGVPPQGRSPGTTSPSPSTRWSTTGSSTR